MKHRDEIMKGVVSDGRKALCQHSNRWYVLVRYRRTFKLKARPEYMIVLGDPCVYTKWSVHAGPFGSCDDARREIE